MHKKTACKGDYLCTPGAGGYILCVDSDLQRGANVTIELVLRTLNIIDLEGVNAHVTFDGSLKSQRRQWMEPEWQHLYTFRQRLGHCHHDNDGYSYSKL